MELIESIESLDEIILTETKPIPEFWGPKHPDRLAGKTTYEDVNSLEGFKIKTNQQEIIVGIDNQPGCCESWGRLSSEDDFKDFIGSTLLDIRLVDENSAVESITSKLKTDLEYGFDGGGIVFVNLVTDRGTLQFAVYNSHNGYYGHNVIVKSDQLNHETTV